MSIMIDIYEQTTDLLAFVENFPKDNDERDTFLVTLNEKLERREQLIKKLEQQILTEAEKNIGRELIELNKKLTTRMEHIRLTIRADISKLEKKKATGLKYENPYDGPTTDGVFFDQQR